jgi:hypothetical protein
MTRTWACQKLLVKKPYLKVVMSGEKVACCSHSSGRESCSDQGMLLFHHDLLVAHGEQKRVTKDSWHNLSKYALLERLTRLHKPRNNMTSATAE